MYYIGEDGSYILFFDSSASTTEICLEFRAAVDAQEGLHQVYLNEHPNLPLRLFPRNVNYDSFSFHGNIGRIPKHVLF
jgi:hypothetical protein